MQEKGHCKHGEFILRDGCPQCLAERRAAGIKPEQDEMESGLNAEGLTLVNAETALAKAPGSDIEAIDYYNEALKLQQYAESRVIATVEDVKVATDDLSIIAKHKKAMEEKRKEYISPLQDQVKGINETYKTLMEPILAADQITRGKILDYRAEQERQRQEAEEIARLEREAAERRAALTGEPMVVPEVVEAPPVAPDRYRSEMGTLGKMMIRKWEVVDLALVPDEYKMIDSIKIGKVVRAGIPSIPGIKIWEEETLRVNAR